MALFAAGVVLGLLAGVLLTVRLTPRLIARLDPADRLVLARRVADAAREGWR